MERKVNEALDAVDTVYRDRHSTNEETIAALEKVKQHIENCIEDLV